MNDRSARFLALLRGVNVSGRRPVRMDELRRSLEELGLGEVRTYLQSGNVVFRLPSDMAPAVRDGGATAARVLAAAIRDQLLRSFGHDVDVLVMPAWRVRDIHAGNPFLSRPDLDRRLLHVTFLFDDVTGDCATESLPARSGEEAAFGPGVVYLLLPKGYGRTKLDNAFFERRCGTRVTTRNWRTVQALAALTEADE